MKNSELVREFMEKFDQDVDRNIFDDDVKNLNLLALRVKMVAEEYGDLSGAAERFTMGLIQDGVVSATRFIDLVDALAGILYVTYGFFHTFGIDCNYAFKTVHNANMSKLGEDGKVKKGPNYQEANLLPIFEDYIKRAAS